MIKRNLISIFIVSLLVVVQSTWLDAIAVFGVIPDLSLLATVYFGFRSPSWQGQFTGFVSGMLQDGITTGIFGLNAFIKTAIAWTFNLLNGKFNIDKILMPFVFGFVSTLLKALYIGLLSLFFSGKISPYNFLEMDIWVEALYNALLAPFIFLLLSPLDKIITMQEKH